MNQNRLRVAVFFGGRSVEHGVSIVTAAQAMAAMDRSRYEVLPVYATEKGEYFAVPEFSVRDHPGLPLNPASFDAFARGKGRRLLVSAEKGRLLSEVRRTPGIGERLSPVEVDVAFSIIHGSHGEDGSLQGVFELADVPYVGPNLVPAAVAMDKIVAKSVFAGLGLPVVEGFWFDRAAWQGDKASVEARRQALGWPVFVKPASLGSSIGVSRAEDDAAFAFAVDTVLVYDQRCIVERSVEGAMDINCSVMRGADGVRVSACERPIKDDEVLDYAAKYLRGSKQEGMAAARRVIPADIPDETASRIRDMAGRVYSELSFRGIARIDFLVAPDGREVYINEINSIPGSLALYFWELEGVAASDVIDRAIEDALAAHREKQRTVYSISQAR
ncbi:MAG TPA: D-alanine--D-alanine ligase [Dehalococcoidia bacterium]|nr:D-alanine--D-alanine ligase [Dehalococcoidia bacterium]